MSREVKYVGMDLHKEAIVIAARKTRGHVVMLRKGVRHFAATAESIQKPSNTFRPLLTQRLRARGQWA